ncbi:uncharacterized protein LOC128203518 [Mya arenaria]|uniref:uncharacterized protein LOC128203518 n=1 Tax=Mya arenaria TaxID=6604 RepID=UPI0022E8910D|nr:uncharacterized protein LOC128203518 [Mya arenaria]XP_052760923.1 uncharacterized protein LOC128203518 [Mya arenaria]XP_052760924.1 uncharacterized protein LOC128203518 [Mya arenaria]
MEDPETTGTTDDNTDVRYTKMERGLVQTTGSYFSMSSGSLPSHIRSVSPRQQMELTLEKDVRKPRTCCNARTVYIALITIFVLTSSVVVAIAVYEIRVIQTSSRSQKLKNHVLPFQSEPEVGHSPPTDVAHVEAAALSPLPSITSGLHFGKTAEQGGRTPCNQICSSYRSDRFQATCHNGHCECFGEDYQRDTCLPDVDGCKIQMSPSSKMISIWGSPADKLSCTNVTSPNTSSDSIYVIGIYGNHFSDKTDIHISGSSEKPITLVLASHYPVRWGLDTGRIKVARVILLAEDKLSFSKLDRFEEKSSHQTRIETYIQPIGYGDDRHHSNTPEMLRKITETFGPVKHFTGALYADTIHINVM